MILAGLGQLGFQLQAPGLDGALLYALAGLAFWQALGGIAPPPALLPRCGMPTPARIASQRVWALATLTVLLVAAGLLAQALGWTPLPLQSYMVLAALAWVGVGLLLDGPVAESRAAIQGALRSITRRQWLALAGILLLAACLRFYHLESLPSGLWFDEAAIGLEAQQIITEANTRPLYATSTTSPAAYVYLVALAEQLFGLTIFAVRVAPALAGVLGTALAFAAGRALWGTSAGLAAAGLFAVARWDITFSRLGMQGATTPVLLLAVCALAVTAVQSGRQSAYAALGVCLGALFWFYSANYFFPAVLIVALAVLAKRDWRAVYAQRKGLAVAAAGALLIATPVFADAAVRPEVVLDRVNVASIFAEDHQDGPVPALLESAGKHLQMLHVRGDKNGRHNLPHAPMLDWATAVLSALGAVASIRWIRDPRSALLLAWPVVMLLPGVLSLSFEAPQGLRSIGALPGALLLAVQGLRALGQLLSHYLRPSHLAAAGAAGLGMITLLNAGTYFGLQANDPVVWKEHSMAQTIIGRYLGSDAAAGAQTLVSVHYTKYPTVEFLARHSYDEFDAALHLPLADSVDTTIFLAPEEIAEFERIATYYPQAGCTGVRYRPVTDAVLYECTITAEAQRAVQGLAARLEGADGTDKAQSGLSGDLTALTAAVAPSQRTVVAGSLLAPEFGRYHVWLAGPAGIQGTLDERPLSGSGSTASGIVLSQGLHALRITGTAAEVAASKLYWAPLNGPETVVPRENLFHAPVAPYGLTGVYRSGNQWEGPPALIRQDTSPWVYFHVPPLEFPFTVEWSGSIYIPVKGEYRFPLEALSYARVEIGDQFVEEVKQGAQVAHSAQLDAGWYPMHIRYLAADGYAHVYLRWQPPGQPVSLIPARYLYPE